MTEKTFDEIFVTFDRKILEPELQKMLCVCVCARRRMKKQKKSNILIAQ